LPARAETSPALVEDRWLAGRLERPVYTLSSELTPEQAVPALVELRERGEPATVQARVDPADVERLGRLLGAGLVLVSTTVTLARAPGPAPVESPSVRELAEADAESLLSIAATSFRTSRFHTDPRLEGGVADRIKRDWVASYLAGDRGERLLVATDEQGQPAGFLAELAGSDDDGARAVLVIDLVAVAPQAQGAGLGRQLVSRFVADARDRGELLRVGTQAVNPRGVRFYERLGFEVEGFTHHLHAHLNTRAGA